MTQEEILDYNKLCAEFLGWEYAKDRDIWNPNMHHDYSFTYSINLKFHSDWNWIFEVVEAIEKLGYYTKNECIRNINYFNIYELENNEATFYGTDNSKKEAVVEAINQFLIWHKTNNNEK